MTIENAKAEMLEKLSAHAEKFNALGFIASVRTYYTDKALAEHEELRRGSETLWCELIIRCEGMGEDDGLIYDLYADIAKDGENIKETQEDSAGIIESALTELYGVLSESDDPKARFMEEYERATAEFNAEIKEFNRKLRRMKFVAYGAAAVAVIAIATVFITSLL